MTITEKIGHFFSDGIWTINEERINPLARWCLRTVRRLVITIECFVHNNLSSYAAALTYSCILAAVPILSIVFAIARGFGFGGVIEHSIRNSLHADEEMTDSVFSFVNHYLEHTHSGVVLGVGLLLLLYTVVMLTSNIETAFNTIWHVPSSRDVYRRILNYTAIFLLFPILVVVSSGFNVYLLTILAELREYAILSHTMGLTIKYAPVVLACLCFVGLYKYMPNIHVRWRAVIVPGCIAGVLFLVLQYFYIHYQLMLSSYNAIYGSFAALPLLMLWLQFSWYICLGCAQLSYACQHDGDYVFAKDSSRISRQEHDSFCLLLMAHITKRFRYGLNALNANELSELTGLPSFLVLGLLYELVTVGLLSEVREEADADSIFQPNVDINRMTVNYVLQQLDTYDRGNISQTWVEANEGWRKLMHLRADLVINGGNTHVADLDVSKLTE